MKNFIPDFNRLLRWTLFQPQPGVKVPESFKSVMKLAEPYDGQASISTLATCYACCLISSLVFTIYFLVSFFTIGMDSVRVLLEYSLPVLSGLILIVVPYCVICWRLYSDMEERRFIQKDLSQRYAAKGFSAFRRNLDIWGALAFVIFSAYGTILGQLFLIKDTGWDGSKFLLCISSFIVIYVTSRIVSTIVMMVVQIISFYEKVTL